MGPKASERKAALAPHAPESPLDMAFSGLRRTQSGRMHRIFTWPWSLRQNDGSMEYYTFEQFDLEGGRSPRRRASYQEMSALGHAPPSAQLADSRHSPKTKAKASYFLLRSQSLCFTAALVVFALLGFLGAPQGFRTFSIASRPGWWANNPGPTELHRPPPAALTTETLSSVQTSIDTENDDSPLVVAVGATGDEPRMAAVDRNSKKLHRPQFVEIMRAGWFVPLGVALNLTLWKEAGIVYNDPENPVGRYARGAEPTTATGAVSKAHRPGAMSNPPAGIFDELSGFFLDGEQARRRCPTGDIRILVAVVARCCGSMASSRREGIRHTWMKLANEHHQKNIDARFFISQPSSLEAYAEAFHTIRSEANMYQDITILPGPDSYLELPRKILEIMQFAVDSPCKYTHVLKIDDDCYLRSDNLLSFIQDGTWITDEKGESVRHAPWMENLYAGRQQGPWTEGSEGFWPDRNPKSKWYLTDEEFPEEIAPIGVKYHLGWGYLLSRDMVEHIVDRVEDYMHNPNKRPGWWGALPWEDTLIGTLLSDKVNVTRSTAFKAAWNECSNDTIVKHLDIDSPEFQFHLYGYEVSGAWANDSVECSTGDFDWNDEMGWKAWRNSLPDVQVNGEE